MRSNSFGPMSRSALVVLMGSRTYYAPSVPLRVVMYSELDRVNMRVTTMLLLKCVNSLAFKGGLRQ